MGGRDGCVVQGRERGGRSQGWWGTRLVVGRRGDGAGHHRLLEILELVQRGGSNACEQLCRDHLGGHLFGRVVDATQARGTEGRLEGCQLGGVHRAHPGGVVLEGIGGRWRLGGIVDARGGRVGIELLSEPWDGGGRPGPQPGGTLLEGVGAKLAGEVGGRHTRLGVEGQGDPHDADQIFPASLADLGRDAGGGSAQGALVPLAVSPCRRRRCAGEQVHQQRTQPVGAGPVGVEAFGRGVAFRGWGGLGAGADHAEARQLHPAQGVDQDLTRRRAGMHNDEVIVAGDGRRGRVDGGGGDGHDLDGGSQGDGLVGFVEQAHDVGDVDAVDGLDHQGGLAAKGGDVLDPQHILVLDARQDLGLLAQRLQHLGLGGSVEERADEHPVLVAVMADQSSLAHTGAPGAISTHQLQLCRGHVASRTGCSALALFPGIVARWARRCGAGWPPRATLREGQACRTARVG